LKASELRRQAAWAALRFQVPLDPIPEPDLPLAALPVPPEAEMQAGGVPGCQCADCRQIRASLSTWPGLEKLSTESIAAQVTLGNSKPEFTGEGS
jgi:hypothetical protein